MGETITAIVGLTGVAVAVLIFWRDFADLRSRRYNERFKNLLEMKDVLAARGPYVGTSARESATAAHEAMLADLDAEARANAVMYMKSAARLKRPGSMSVAIGIGGYGIAIMWLVLSGVLPAIEPDSEHSAVSLFVAQLVLLGIGLGAFVGGVFEGVRRWLSRGIRLAVGHEDELTVDWWRQIAKGVREKRAARTAEAGASAAE
ncbi:hypothetical protein GCM10027413_24500 [Conyzicola nivalis]|nr:hypothetical protein [Conyzicola nivalis]